MTDSARSPDVPGQLSSDVNAQWQLIETAPKDSTEVWLGAEGRVIVGWWSREHGSWHSSWSDDRLQWEPTHWLPFLIPSPPVAP